jgi:hypothetical protein
MKKIWLSAVDTSKEDVQKIMTLLKAYGMEGNGHFWEDNPEKFAWSTSRKELLNPDVALWIILASGESLARDSIRYGLSLLTLSLQESRGANFPVIILHSGPDTLKAALPGPLAGAEIYSVTNPVLGAKLVAGLHRLTTAAPPPYRLDVYGIPQVGQWFEIGPREQIWSGAMFGVNGAEITLHAVGTKGQLPERSVLNYPLQGIRIEAKKKQYTAWAVKNELSADLSYYIRVEGMANSLLFSPFAEQNDPEVYIIDLT